MSRDEITTCVRIGINAVFDALVEARIMSEEEVDAFLKQRELDITLGANLRVKT
jgi:hypothetical protein